MKKVLCSVLGVCQPPMISLCVDSLMSSKDRNVWLVGLWLVCGWLVGWLTDWFQHAKRHSYLWVMRIWGGCTFVHAGRLALPTCKLVWQGPATVCQRLACVMLSVIQRMLCRGAHQLHAHRQSHPWWTLSPEDQWYRGCCLWRWVCGRRSQALQVRLRLESWLSVCSLSLYNVKSRWKMNVNVNLDMNIEMNNTQMSHQFIMYACSQEHICFCPRSGLQLCKWQSRRAIKSTEYTVTNWKYKHSSSSWPSNEDTDGHA